MKKELEFLGHTESIKILKFSDDGNFLASLGYDDTIRIWSITGNKGVECYNYKYQVNYKAIGFSLDNKLYAVGTLQVESDGKYKIVIADVNKKKNVASIKLDSKGYPFTSNMPENIAFNPKTNLVAAIYSCIEVVRPYKGGDILLWQLNKKLFGYGLKEVASMCGRATHYKFPLLAFNPEGKMLVTTQPVMVKSSMPGNRWVAVVEFWNAESGKLVDMIEIPDLLGIKSINFTSDGNIFLGTERSGLKTFQLWDKQRNNILTIEHSAKIISSAISSDGRFLATGDGAGVAKISSFPQGKEIAVIQADSQKYGVSFLTFSPNAKTIALAADKIELWEF
jgi:WD40 repeat protein